jgi:alpha-ketoglutarate-dependent taurine dioxygenase
VSSASQATRAGRPVERAESDGFDEARVAVPPAVLELVTADEPDDRAAAAARAGLAPLLREFVDAGPGVLVLTGLPAEQAAAERAVVAVSRLLGTVLPQNREGTLVREVRDRGMALGEGARGRYSDSRLGGSLHTDGAEAPLPAPELFTLLCVRQSLVGGALQFVHVRDLLAALADGPEVLATLRAPFHFDRRGDHEPGEPPTTEKPILFHQSDRPAITYLRGYVERGHEHPGVPPLTDAQRAALDELDALTGSGAHARTGKLREGELAIFDNLSLLHGRTEFQDDPARTRLLLRTWIRRGAGTPA